MIDVGSLSPAVRAGVLIGAVLAEAMVLYVAYGLAERVGGRALIQRIKGS